MWLNWRKKKELHWECPINVAHVQRKWHFICDISRIAFITNTAQSFCVCVWFYWKQTERITLYLITLFPSFSPFTLSKCLFCARIHYPKPHYTTAAQYSESPAKALKKSPAEPVDLSQTRTATLSSPTFSRIFVLSCYSPLNKCHKTTVLDIFVISPFYLCLLFLSVLILFIFTIIEWTIIIANISCNTHTSFALSFFLYSPSFR